MSRSTKPPRPEPARGELVIDSSDAEHVIATFNPLLIVVFKRVPAPHELDIVQRRAKQAFAAGIRGGLLYVVDRKDMSGGVDPRVRKVFEGMIRDNEEQSGQSAVVVLTTGFAAAVVRGALAGLLSVFQQRKRLRVFATVEEAIAWLAPQHDLGADTLLRAYRQATSQLTST